MKEALVSTATGALQAVLGKLAALLGDDSNLFHGERSEVELLTSELAAIEAFVLMKLTEEDPSTQDKAWMKEVRELSYDIEDDLDEFMNPVDDKPPAKPDGFMDMIKAMLDQTRAHHQIAKAIDNLKKEQVVQVAKRHKACEAGSSNASNASKVDPRALAIFKDMSKLVDVDGHKKELIQLLTDCESTQQQPNIVAVVGLEGLGKTTLANQVYQKLKGQFECHVFVSVSQNPDIIKVICAIYSQLNEKYSPGMEDLPQLITMILDFLKNKRYFIVVDDIWDVETWKAIKCAFAKISYGSKIMITTRIDDVAQSCCGHIYNIRPLTMAQSRKLFYERIFSSQEKCPSHLERICHHILDKCACLPLAIIIISGVLAHRESENELWEQVKDSIGHALRNSTIDVMAGLARPTGQS
ncbi:hypothetical protein ACQJBY_061727 [Aegilops geniculata]